MYIIMSLDRLVVARRHKKKDLAYTYKITILERKKTYLAIFHVVFNMLVNGVPS